MFLKIETFEPSKNIGIDQMINLDVFQKEVRLETLLND